VADQLKRVLATAHRARQLLDSGQSAQALDVAESAAAAGDADASYLLATWYLGGYPVTRDVPRALELLGKANDEGHTDAAQMHIALIANGAVQPPNWVLALSMLREAARTQPVAQRQLELLSRMALGSDGNPTSRYNFPKTADAPVQLIPNLLTADECLYVAAKAAPSLAHSQVADPSDGSLKPHPVRRSLDMVIGPSQEDLVVGAINRRIAAVSGTDFLQGEPLSVLCYPVGGEYRPHLDALPDSDNLRIRTCAQCSRQATGGNGGDVRQLLPGWKARPEVSPCRPSG
jgi:prolyl 4-hydroxylase